MLGAVVLEQPAQVALARQQRQVAEEDRGAHAALDQPEQHGGAEPVLDQAGQHDRDDEEQADGERERGDDRERPLRLADRLLVLRRPARWR